MEFGLVGTGDTLNQEAVFLFLGARAIQTRPLQLTCGHSSDLGAPVKTPLNDYGDLCLFLRRLGQRPMVLKT